MRFVHPPVIHHACVVRRVSLSKTLRVRNLPSGVVSKSIPSAVPVKTRKKQYLRFADEITSPRAVFPPPAHRRRRRPSLKRYREVVRGYKRIFPRPTRNCVFSRKIFGVFGVNVAFSGQLYEVNIAPASYCNGR